MLRSAVSDGLRYLWALLYWNLRKGIYAAFRRKGQPPCQHRLDDERPVGIQCIAVLHWEDPARFQRVCPCLKRQAMGWRCTAKPAEVKPYWGRAVTVWGGITAALYLFVTVAIWGGMQFVGDAPVAWWRIAWPGAWSSIPRIQSEQLYLQSLATFNQGDYAKAYRTLIGARVRYPANYDAALLMGQISMYQGSYAYADGLFNELINAFPDKSLNTALGYQETLLALNRMGQLAEFSFAMVQRFPAQTTLWVRSLLLTLSDAEVAQPFAETHAEEFKKLPAFARLLVESRLLITQGETAEAKARLREVFRGPWNVDYINAQITMLREAGDTSAAAFLLGYYAAALGNREAMAQQYLIDRQNYDLIGARAGFAILLRGVLQVSDCERLQELLLEAPDRESYLQLHARLLSDPSLRAGIDGGGMWITGLICDAPEEAAVWKNPDQLVFGAKYPEIAKVDFRSDRIDAANSVVHIINIVKLPRDIVMELLTQMHETRGHTALQSR